MADSSFAPPSGPPPPKVPEGWKAVWNEQYKEWFYVNIYTKASQWDKPTEPIYPPGEHPPDAPPPTYNHGEAKPVAPEKTGLSANNPYAMPASGGAVGASSSHSISEDERLARQLQEEENAKGGKTGDRGLSDSFYNEGGQPPQYGQQYQQQYGGQAPYGQQQQPYGQAPYDQQQFSQDKGKSKGGFLGKLLGKSSQSKPQNQYPPQQQYYQGPPQGQYGYAPQQGYYGQQAQGGRKPGGGMGMAGGAALGVGAGLLGGALIADTAAHMGGDDGGDFGGDDGGDFGGGDFGGDF